MESDYSLPASSSKRSSSLVSTSRNRSPRLPAQAHGLPPLGRFSLNQHQGPESRAVHHPRGGQVEDQPSRALRELFQELPRGSAEPRAGVQAERFGRGQGLFARCTGFWGPGHSPPYCHFDATREGCNNRRGGKELAILARPARRWPVSQDAWPGACCKNP
jgi:hypothetical protein